MRALRILWTAKKRERVVGEKDTTCGCYTPVHERRSVLKVACGAGLGLLWRHLAMAPDVGPRKARPQVGDHVVFTSGDRLFKQLAARLQQAPPRSSPRGAICPSLGPRPVCAG